MRDKYHVLIANADTRVAFEWEQALERGGYYVSCAAQDPADLLRMASERIDAVIAVVPWCGMTSAMLVQRTRRYWPQARLLLSAGEETQPASEAGVRCLPKVVTTRVLKKHLEQLLQFHQSGSLQSGEWHEGNAARAKPANVAPSLA